WAVGDYANGGGSSFTQVLRYSDPCAPATQTRTPTATYTAPPTSTPTPAATNTPANTPCATLTLFTEGFESGTLNTFTSQVAQCGTGGCGYNPITNAQHSGVYSAFAPNVSSTSDQRMVLSAPVAIPAGTSAATLSFWHKYHFD